MKDMKKMIAAVMAFAMVLVAGFIVIGDDSESDAASNDITYLGGTITGNAEQTFGPGSNVVVEKDLVIPADKTLIIGGKFTVNEGAELTIKGNLYILPGASATFNADVKVENEATLYNAAFYDGTNKVNGSYIGFFLNADLIVEKGGSIEGIDSAILGNSTTEATDDASAFTAVQPYDMQNDRTISVTYGNVAYKASTKTIYLAATTAIPYHMNGAGNMGYWVAVSISLVDSVANSDVKLTYDGRTSDSAEKISADKKLTIWVAAGTVTPVTYTYQTASTKVTESYTIDATNCLPVTSGDVPGQIIINDGGSFTTSSTKTTMSKVVNQTIFIKEGATADLNGVVDNVTVSAFGTGVRTQGSVYIDTSADLRSAANYKIVKLSFSSVSEKIATAYNGSVAGVTDNDKTTKAVNYVLLVSGTVADTYTLDIKKTDAIAGAKKVLMSADTKGNRTDVPLTGIVRVATDDALKVGENGKLDIKPGSILEVVGTVSIDGKKGATTTAEKASLTISGKVIVTGNISIGEVEVAVGQQQTMTGAVCLKFNQNGGRGLLIVSGNGHVTIQDYEMAADHSNLPSASLGASFTDDDDVYHIMTLANAIDAAKAAGVEEINTWSIPAVTGISYAQDLVINTDLTIPKDMTLTIQGTIVVAKGSTLTFEEDSDFTYFPNENGALIVVEGDVYDYTMTSMTNAALTRNQIHINAEVMFIDSAETYYRYTTLADALNGAAEGSTIELFGNVDVKNNLTIGKGITVLANGKTLTVENDSELVVEGVLDLVNKRNGSTADGKVILIAKTNYKAAGKLTVNNIVVIGGISSINEFTVSTSTTANKYVAGFYAYGTIGDLTDENFILAPAVAAANSKTLEDLKVYTKTTYSGDLVFDGGDEVQTITVDANASATPAYTGNLKVGKITLRNYNLIIDEGALFNGTVAGANGAIEAVNIMGASGATVTFSDVVDTDKGTDILSIAGTPEMVDSEGKKTAVEANNTATMSVIDGTVVSGAFTANNLKFFNIKEGTVLEVSSNSGSVTFGASDMTVDGTVNVMKNGTLNVTTLTINGIVYVKVATADDSSYGSITATTIYVGTNSKAITTTGAVATLSADAVNSLAIIYVADGANVSEKILKGVNSTEFYVEDALWMTVYQKSGEVKVTSITKAPVTDAKFVGWKDSNGKAFDATATPPYNPIIGAAGAEKVYAIINYNIYNVSIIGDAGIGSIAIDGVVLIKGGDSGENVFTPIKALKAGTHTVTYVLKDGFEGSPVLLKDGSSLGGLTFSLSGIEDSDTTVVLNLSGTKAVDPVAPEPTPIQPSEKDDSMGITEYLLIVLVVLAAILVVVVAIRMMRS